MRESKKMTNTQIGTIKLLLRISTKPIAIRVLRAFCCSNLKTAKKIVEEIENTHTDES